MPSIRTIDLTIIEDIFEMGRGYVLDFSDRSMAQFFATELDVDIDNDEYRAYGSSKAKRLRCFLAKVDVDTGIKALNALWEYRETSRARREREEWVPNAEGQFLSLIRRLQGKPDIVSATGVPPRPAFDKARIAQLKQALLDLSGMAPQPRGFAFESWLGELFNFYGLQAREPFRNRGEQIDGSFVLNSDTYLLEAKWQAAPVGVAELHAFQGKVDDKAAWARGLFISDSGFSADGLQAFGRGKKVVCMDGLDLCDILDRGLPLDAAIERKVRRAAETGRPFERIRDIFAT